MRWLLATALLVLLVLGFLTLPGVKGFAQVLLVSAGGVLLVRLIVGRRAPPGTLEVMNAKECSARERAKEST